MLYIDAFSISHSITPFKDCEKWPCTCPECATLLTPLHVDDKEGVHFLRCPYCGEIYKRPAWYETDEERLIQLLLEKIASLEARITALERRQPLKPKDESMIELPQLLTAF